ncbi:MAG TPA: hypothetical protein VGN00_19765 [Puia sp.]|jgi:hypothetical protein
MQEKIIVHHCCNSAVGFKLWGLVAVNWLTFYMKNERRGERYASLKKLVEDAL